MRDWNNGALPARYAAGVNLAAAARTGYRWSFVDHCDPVRLGQAVDEVDKATHADELIRVGADDQASSITQKKTKKEPESTSREVSTESKKKRKEKDSSDSDDSAERRWQEKQAAKREAKAYAKRKEAVLEELVPKPTGKDAQLEKKRQESAYHRRGDEDAQGDLESFDPFGGEGLSIKARIAREKAFRQRQADAKLDSYHKALADYNVCVVILLILFIFC